MLDQTIAVSIHFTYRYTLAFPATHIIREVNGDLTKTWLYIFETKNDCTKYRKKYSSAPKPINVIEMDTSGSTRTSIDLGIMAIKSDDSAVVIELYQKLPREVRDDASLLLGMHREYTQFHYSSTSAYHRYALRIDGKPEEFTLSFIESHKYDHSIGYDGCTIYFKSLEDFDYALNSFRVAKYGEKLYGGLYLSCQDSADKIPAMIGECVMRGFDPHHLPEQY